MGRYNIAIIGMGCVFPGATSVEQYWENILSGNDFFTQMPKRLWHMDNFCSDNRSRPEKSYTNIGAFIDYDKIDFPFIEYKLPPNAMKGSDPAQLVSLVATKQALKDAGIEPRSDQLKQGMTIIGASGVDAFAHSTIYLKRHNFLRRLRPKLEARGVSTEQLDRLDEELRDELLDRGHDWNPSIVAVGAVVSSVSNRLAQVFGIKGPNMTVDGACGSSFVALDIACHALMAGDSRVVVSGGVDLGTNPAIYAGFSRVDGLSLKGSSNPFDHTADGLVIGEGVGIVILKRLEDALADGDRIRGVIRGMGSSSDGAGQAIYAPSVEGRARALRHAFKSAEIDSNRIQFLEAHATSTIVGDANEYDAISTVYGPGRDESNPLMLGSVKHQIGHLKAAAGVAGLIKAVVAMETGTIPHMPKFTKLTPEAHMPHPALQIPTSPQTWKSHEDGLRTAAVTTSGFGGVNYHAIVEHADTYAPPESRPEVSREIAIVGVRCRIASEDSVDGFWKNVTQEVDMFSKVDPQALGWEEHVETGPQNERIVTHAISKLAPYKFDLLRHKIFPKAVSQISQTQFLALDLADKLLGDAGFELREPKRIGVSIGTMHDDNFPKVFFPIIADEFADAVLSCPVTDTINGDLLQTSLEETVQAIREEGPPVTEHTLPGWMTNVIAGRIANKLNLHGPNFTVDTACSSGLAALMPAMYQLMFGNVEMMVSGGLNQQMTEIFTAAVSGLDVLALTTPKPYDVDGHGFLIGEGGVLYLLKRLEDAKRDNDDILAVLHGVSGSSEADSRSMIAPSERAIRRSIRNTISKTSIRHDQIGVVETHGSANPISDRTEARSIAAELRPDKSVPPIKITAIKSHVGHLYGGSGASSLLSVIQTLRERTVPKIKNLNTVQPQIAALSDAVEPSKETAPLENGFTAAGVNSIGLGGANYFAVVSSPNGAADQEKKEEVFVQGSVGKTRTPIIRAGDEASADIFVCLAEKVENLGSAVGRAVQQQPIPEFISEGSTVGARLAITFEDQADLKTKLGKTLQMIEGGHSITPLESLGVFCAEVEPQAAVGKLAFCFPGQGTHYITMGRFLYEQNPLFKGVLDQVDELARREFDFNLLGHIYGDENDPAIAKALGTLVGAQTALFSIELGMAKVLEQLGIVPDVMIGHSFGEISALTVAGVWDIETAYQVVKSRIRAVEQINKSNGPALGMMSVICSSDQRDAILDMAGDRVEMTNINGPNRFIFAGELDAIKRTVALAESFGTDARLLPIGGAFHSRFMEPAREPFKTELLKLPCAQPKVPILSTITGKYIDPAAVTTEHLAEHLSSQLVTRLDLPREINHLYGDGVQEFLEVGPGWSMTKMISGILDGRPFRAAPTLHPKVGDVETFRRARAFLIALGHLDSAADRQNLPGMFSPDFIDYMETYEPSVISLIEEVHHRFLSQVRVNTSPRIAARAEVKQQPAPAAIQSAPEPAPMASEPTAAPPAPESTPAAAPNKADVSVWVERLRTKLVEVTGYPAEMLEEHLDLEADLGIDSVQRAEIWVALTTEHKLDSEKRPSGVRTLTNLAQTLAEMAIECGAVPQQQEAPPPPAPPEEPAAPVVQQGDDLSVWVGRLREKLVQVTGYPAEMLEDHLDLEADLGIDSVQRAEIWVALTTEHQLDAEKRPTGPRTITGLAESLMAMSAEAAGASTAQPAAATAQGSQPAAAGDTPGCQLFTPSFERLTDDQFTAFDCRRVIGLVDGDDALTEAIGRQLSAQNIEYSTIVVDSLASMSEGDLRSALGGADTVLYLAHHRLKTVAPEGFHLHQALRQETRRLYQSFQKLAAPLAERPMRVVVPISRDGVFGASERATGRFLGAFPAGFVRSLARELEACTFQLVDVGSFAWEKAIARDIALTYDKLEIGHSTDGRGRPVLAPVAQASAGSPTLTSGDLLLVTGGARGIVFECVLALAQKTGCKLLLTGRTELPTDRPAWMATAPDQIDTVIRELEIELVRQQQLPLAKAKKRGVQARAQWELSRNLERLEQNGVQSRYEVCDVTNIESFTALVQRVAQTEPIRGVVLGAGVQRAKRITELDEETIFATLDTKLNPLFALIDTLDWRQAKLLSAFGSVAGLFGNAGQTDYALANDLLAAMVNELGAHHPQLRAQTIDWTAWSGTGMVTEEEAKRFAQSGLTALDVASGISLFLDGVTGSSRGELAAFNSEAAYVSGRQVSSTRMASRPLPHLLDVNSGGQKARFSLPRDVYLEQHLVRHEPVVPGTFITELLCESLAQNGQWPCDIRFRRPLQIRHPEFEIELVRDGDRVTVLPADRPTLDEKGQSNLAFATCRVASSQVQDRVTLDFTSEDLQALRDAKSQVGPSFYNLLDSKFSEGLSTGPIFRGLHATVERNGLFFGLVSLTDDALAMLETPGKFEFNPILADMAVQVTCTWAMVRHQVLAIPAEIDTLSVLGKTEQRDAVVICAARDINPEQTVVDIAVRELDNRLIMAVDRLVLKTILHLDS